MAAFGILAALRERDRSGEGQLVDVSMADGALSWLAMVAARYFADGVVPQRGELELAGRLACYRPVRVQGRRLGRRCGALEPKFWQAWCRGVGREDLIEQQFERARLGRRTREVERGLRSSARATSGRRSPPSTTAAWSRCSTSTRRSTPSSCARARWSSSSTSRARARRCGCSACRSSSRARRATRRARPGPALGEHTDEVLAAPATTPSEIAALKESGAVAGPGGRRSQGSFLGG